MSHSSPTFDSASHHITTYLLAATSKAGSYPPPSAPAFLQHIHYRHVPPPQFHYAAHEYTEYLPDPIEDIVFRLLAWPLSSVPLSSETVTLGLPLIISCFEHLAAEHMHYDERLHRLCLRSDSDIMWRGEQLGLLKGYLDWLCAEGQKESVNILKIECGQLEKGLERWQEVAGRRL